MTTILITGVPRSGTNLVCACLNTIPDCVALTEPMETVPRHGDAGRAVDEIVRFAETTRDRLLMAGSAPARTVNGVITDNFFAEAANESGVRPGLHDAAVTDIAIGKPLGPDFRLFIKHPAIFTVLAHTLSARLPVYAIVRHPLAALASWHSVDIAPRHGHWPIAEAFAPQLRERLSLGASALHRQVTLVQWIFQVYQGLPRDRVLGYEAIARNPGAALSPLSGSSAPISYPMRAISLKARYPAADLAAIARALVTIEADVEPYYPNFVAGLRPFLAGPDG